VDWLVISIVLSVILTVILNIGLRAFPQAGERAARGLEQMASRGSERGDGDDGRARVYVPWKAMLLVSLGLTLALNLLIWIF
jgi:hypothetical protein